MDLTYAMRAATQDPPVTSIDVDQLIAGERRRSRRLRAAAGALTVAVLATGVALPWYLSQQPTDHSPGLAPPSVAAGATRSPAACVVPSPTVTALSGNAGKEPELRPLVPVTEPCGSAIARLSDELTALLPRLVPGAMFTNARDGSPLPALVQKEGGPQVGYTAGFNLQGGVMSVRVEATTETPEQFRVFAQEQCAQPGGHCRSAALGGAELLIRSDVTGGYGIDVWAVRPDGTLLLALTRATPPGGPTPLTEQQLIDLVMTPALTLYP